MSGQCNTNTREKTFLKVEGMEAFKWIQFCLSFAGSAFHRNLRSYHTDMTSDIPEVIGCQVVPKNVIEAIHHKTERFCNLSPF